ncbi:MAG: division/cell wall cluster transcriptional repressor MraZ [Bacilli bacterium]
MLMGEFHHNIDDKGRIIIPTKLRNLLNEQIIITRGLDGCLFAYSKLEFDKIVNKLKTLPFTKKDARSFNRFFLSGATECLFDKQGRINIPSPLCEYAALEKDCIIIGMNDRIEIWDKNKFNSFMNSNKEDISEIAENLFGDDFNL